MHPTANLKLFFSSDTGIHATKKNFSNSVAHVFYLFLGGRTYMCVNTLCYLAFRHRQDFLRKTKAVLYPVVRVSGNA